MDREKIINAIEKAKKQSEEYAQDRIIVPFKEADMILALLKEQKHGEWITIWDKYDPDTSHEGRCSICNRISNRPLGGYCKWCGAIMDKEFGS